MSNIEWYSSETTRETKPLEVDCTLSDTTVFLRRNIHREERSVDFMDTYLVWAYEETKLTHEEYEEMLTEKIAEITPYTVTKTAYIDDTEITFTEVPDGTMSVFVKDTEGNYPHYTAERTANRVIIHFIEPLNKVTTVTISIL